MHHFNKDKLWVSYRIDNFDKLIPRRYTLTHSDETGDLFLIIDSQYHYEYLTEKRDELLGSIEVTALQQYYFSIYLRVDGEDGTESSIKRNEILKRELPLALSAIKYGDYCLFKIFPQLEQASIYVYFQSQEPSLNRVESYGTFSDY